jgi:hypothetical protein
LVRGRPGQPIPVTFRAHEYVVLRVCKDVAYAEAYHVTCLCTMFITNEYVVLRVCKGVAYAGVCHLP